MKLIIHIDSDSLQPDQLKELGANICSSFDKIVGQKPFAASIYLDKEHVQSMQRNDDGQTEQVETPLLASTL